jgi:NADP-dependent 3-hydroxy acid dehydrogenase YdfG
MNKRILITGNPTIGLARELKQIFSDAEFVSRQSGYDLTKKEFQELLAKKVLEFDVFINCSALWKFNQTILLDVVYKSCINNQHRPHIICVGSTTDRVKNGKIWLYNAEKKALRDYCNTLSLASVWGDGPKVTYISFGTLSNNQEKHPDRRTMKISQAADYVKWIIDQPENLSINEISIDPLQSERWHCE